MEPWTFATFSEATTLIFTAAGFRELARGIRIKVRSFVNCPIVRHKQH